MSHITIVINRTQPPQPSADRTVVASEPEEGVNYVSVTYTPPDSATDAEVGQAVRKLFKQVRELGV